MLLVAILEDAHAFFISSDVFILLSEVGAQLLPATSFSAGQADALSESPEPCPAMVVLPLRELLL